MKALFLDLDGTVRSTINDKPCPSEPEEQYVLPGRYEKIWAYKDNGYKIIGVTNQKGVEQGYLTMDQMKNCLTDLNMRLDVVFDEMLAATTEDSPNAKPKPGMFEKAIDKYQLDPSQCIMVGDQDIDKQAAEAAGIHTFYPPPEFFEESV